MDRVSVIAKDADSKGEMAGIDVQESADNKADEGAKRGALTGGTLGGLTGLLVGPAHGDTEIGRLCSQEPQLRR